MSRVGRAALVVGLLLLEVPGMGATLRSGRLELGVSAQPPFVVIALVDHEGAESYGGRPYCYALRPEGAQKSWWGLERARVQPGKREIVISGRLAGSLVEVRQVWTGGGHGACFEERITVTNTGPQPIAVAEVSFGLRQLMGALVDKRLVAIPYRRQCDGKLHDYGLDDLRAGRYGNSDWRNDASVADQEVCDQGKLRSEGWSLSDGQGGLVIIKYNPEHIEYGLAFPDGDEFQLGGAGLSLYREPRAVTLLEPGVPFTFGVTRYQVHDGGWPEAYRLFREFMDAHGHDLTPDYDPPVNWNELFDVGWYHSDRAALFQHYTREALLREAAKAKQVGCELLYLDPGWEVCEGTTLWDQGRLGSVQSLADELRQRFGLGLGYRTIGRVYRDEFANNWYLRREGQQGPYQQPALTPAAAAEPAPLRDERGCRNLALLPGASVSASSVIPGYPELHTIEHLCDGWYSNPASWISAREPSWVELDLGDEYVVDTIVLGSEHKPHYRDRAITAFTAEVTAAPPEAQTGAKWTQVLAYDGEPIHGTRAFRLAARRARRVRLNVRRTEAGDQARIDELEVYEAQPGQAGGEPQRGPQPKAGQGSLLGFWEVCTQCREWQEEKLKRILDITRHGVGFMMFDEFDWRGPCYDPSHGHPVPSTPEGHVRAIYGLIEAAKRECPGLLVEAHDPVWPWAMRYVPTYFRQSLTGRRYDENWGFEFMWNPIEDLRSRRALCLYYYNLAYSIPLYDHLTMEGDNDNCLAFWWYASTVRHLGIGGRKGLNSTQENEARYAAYQAAMATYRRLKPWFTRGVFVGLDELVHLHTLPGRAGGVVLAFNLDKGPAQRDVVIPWRLLGVTARQGEGLHVSGPVRSEAGKEGLRLSFELPPESPVLVVMGQAAEAVQ